MSADHHPAPVERRRDPVCGMSVRLDAAAEEGLVVEHDGQTVAFCREACRDAFLADPARFAAELATSAVSVAPAAADGAPRIDDGMRLWYESCSCCLSDAYPDVKAALDAERAAQQQPTADPGICEVAEAATEAEPATVSGGSPAR